MVYQQGRDVPPDFRTSGILIDPDDLWPQISAQMGEVGSNLFYDGSGLIVGPGTVETDASSFTLPANTVEAPSALEFNLAVLGTNSAGSTKNLTTALYVGATKIISCVTAVPDSRVSAPTYLRAILYTQPSFNRLIGYGFDQSTNDEDTSFPAVRRAYNAFSFAAKQSAIDFTVDNIIKVTMKMEAATLQYGTLGSFSIKLLKEQS